MEPPDDTSFHHVPMVEDYIRQLPEDDENIMREYYIPITKTVKEMRATLLGASKTEDQVLEEAVRERCGDVPKKRIKKIINILNKAQVYIQPRMFEMTTGMKSGRLQDGICVPGSNCHYTKEFLMERITFFTKVNQISDGKGCITINPFNFHTHDYLSATKVISPINLSNYKQMKIIEMVPGVVNTNRVIYCTLIVDGHVMGSFHTVVEDDFGQCAKLSICNTSPEFQSSLKKGANIAIANPYYKLGTTDECYFIRMDSPGNIIPIEKNSSLNRSSEYHKIEGNKHFEADEYFKAVSCYTNAIAKDSSNPVYLSNRALCYLKLDSFEDALQDAEAAVELDPNTHKYLYRLAMAWSGLGDHEKSVEILESIQENSDCSAVLCKERKLLDNTRGKFDFDELAQKAKSGEKLEIADYIGPIIIDKSKHGHGVFATRDIKKGELICVHKAIAYLAPKKKNPLTDKAEIVYFAHHVAISPKSYLPKLKQILTEKISKSKLSAFRFFMLFTKHTNSEPISIELYRNKGYELIREKEKPPFQMDTLTTLIQQNTLAYYDPAEPHNEEMFTIGTWLIRGFLNHACLPNTLLTLYKDVCIVRAIVRIPKGTEVTSQWVSISFNVEERQAQLKEWDVFCDCESCEFESDPRNKTALEKAVLLKERADKLTDIKCNPEYPEMQDAEFELLNEAFSLAKEMKLGPTRFNMALWQAIQYLLSSCPKPRDHKKFLKSLYRAKSFLCDFELQHQRDFFDIWFRFNNICQAPLSNECKREVREIRHIISSYLTYIP